MIIIKTENRTKFGQIIAFVKCVRYMNLNHLLLCRTDTAVLENPIMMHLKYQP